MKKAEPTKTLLQALAVVAELTQTDLSEPAAAVMAGDLARYPEDQVLGALQRCRRELKRGQLTIAAVLERLDDGRPGPEEAWSMLPKDGNDALNGHYVQGESSYRNPTGRRWLQEKSMTVVWTVEMQAASAIADALIRSGDTVQARMAFLETYRRLVQQARDRGERVQWQVSPGTDHDQKALVLIDAAEKGRLPVNAVRRMLPYYVNGGVRDCAACARGACEHLTYHAVDEGVEARLLAIEGKAMPKALVDKDKHREELRDRLSGVTAALTGRP